MVRWLRLHIPTAGRWVHSLTNQIPHATTRKIPDMASKIPNASVKTSFSQINKLKFLKINIESKLLHDIQDSDSKFYPGLTPATSLHPTASALWNTASAHLNTEPHPNWIHLLCTFLCSQGSLCLDRVSLSLSLSLPLLWHPTLFKAQFKHLREAIPRFRAPHAALVTCNPPNASAAHSAVLPTRFGIFCLMLFPAVNPPLREKPHFPAFCLLRGA